MPKPGRRGRPREVEFQEVINAVRYLVRSGCGWRMLPIHFGPWRTVYGWFRELARRFLFQTIHDLAMMVDRDRAGREPSPSAGGAHGDEDHGLGDVEAGLIVAHEAAPPCHPAEGAFDHLSAGQNLEALLVVGAA